MADSPPTEEKKQDVPEQAQPNPTKPQAIPMVKIDQSREQILANIRAVTSATREDIFRIKRDRDTELPPLLDRFVSIVKANETIPAAVLEKLEKGQDAETIRTRINREIRAVNLELVEDGNGLRVISTKFKESAEVPESLQKIHEELLELGNESRSENVRKLFRLIYRQFHGIPMPTVMSYFQDTVPEGQDPKIWVRNLINNRHFNGGPLEKRPFKIHVRNGVVILGPREEETIIMSPRTPDPQNTEFPELPEGYQLATIEDIRLLLRETRRLKGKIGVTEIFLTAFLEAAKKGEGVLEQTLKQKYEESHKASSFQTGIKNVSKDCLKPKGYIFVRTLKPENTLFIAKKVEAKTPSSPTSKSTAQERINYGFLSSKTLAKGGKPGTTKTFLDIFQKAETQGTTVTNRELKETYRKLGNNTSFFTAVSTFRQFLGRNGYKLVETGDPESSPTSRGENTLTIQPTRPPASPQSVDYAAVETPLQAEIAALREELERTLEGTRAELASTKEALDAKVVELTAAKEAIDTKGAELAAAKEAIDTKVAELASAKEAIDTKVAELAAAQELAQRIFDTAVEILGDVLAKLPPNEGTIPAKTPTTEHLPEIQSGKPEISQLPDMLSDKPEIALNLAGRVVSEKLGELLEALETARKRIRELEAEARAASEKETARKIQAAPATPPPNSQLHKNTA